MTSDDRRRPEDNRPWKFVLLIAAAVFIAEAIIMVALNLVWPHPTQWEFFVDAVMLVLVMAPLLYIWLYRPLVIEIEERKAAEARLEDAVRELTAALENVRNLRGLLPICAWCRKIRNDRGYWQQLEAYVVENSDAEFTHGICPDCASDVLSGVDSEKERNDRDE